MDVGEWLRSLGLSRYEEAFREAEIGPDVLPDLTDSDLEKLGVPLGDRKRLLKAIASFGPAHMVAEPRGPSPTPPPTDAAERRQLTVMFCDLVGSTALSARLDPEDMREVIAAYQKCVSETVHRFGGFVAKYMGDGVLAYFGYPQAHEHDAERAVRAGLAVIEAVPTLQTGAGAPLHVRAGLATGIVVVGDLLGSGEAQERGVFGDTPHLAARLQVIAQPDSVVLAEGTRKLVGDLFEIVDLGPQKLKGVAGTTLAFGALRESPQANRFEALHPGGLAALVGREAECELLLRCWAKAKGGPGPGRAHLGRGGHRQIQADGRISGTTAGRTAHAAALFLLAPAHRQCALPNHRPHRAGSQLCARGRCEDEARQARSGAL
jgi:class 3 adenylate cyclase